MATIATLRRSRGSVEQGGVWIVTRGLAIQPLLLASALEKLPVVRRRKTVFHPGYVTIVAE
jgi:hypothetical protein